MEKQSVRFTPTAWAKLVYMRDAGDTEISAFGLAETDDPLLITDLVLPKQECTGGSTEIEGESILEYMDTCASLGMEPDHYLRIWLHTHPGNCARPSATDEETFGSIFGSAPWAIMVIVANGGDEYCHCQYGQGIGGRIETTLEIDFFSQFSAPNREAWKTEYDARVSRKVWTTGKKTWEQEKLPSSWNDGNRQNAELGGKDSSKWDYWNWTDDDDETESLMWCSDCGQEWDSEAHDYGENKCPHCGSLAVFSY